jgi:hypothetical protein
VKSRLLLPFCCEISAAKSKQITVTVIPIQGNLLNLVHNSANAIDILGPVKSNATGQTEAQLDEVVDEVVAQFGDGFAKEEPVDEVQEALVHPKGVQVEQVNGMGQGQLQQGGPGSFGGEEIDKINC